MNIILRSAINRYAHQTGINHTLAVKQDLMTKAAEMWDEGKEVEDILTELGIPVSGTNEAP